MQKLTPWFEAKLHSPAREGWYDCKECKARHYFKEGLWYRNKKSLRTGPMFIRKMHWRGLLGVTSEDYERDNAPLTVKQVSALRRDVEKHHPRGKLLSKKSLFQAHQYVPISHEEQEWLDMPPVGHEFGSPDYEKLLEEDSRRILGNLTRLVSKCRGTYDTQSARLKDKKIRKAATNVQAALAELGFEVGVEDAAAVWIRHSNSMCAGWMAGAETVRSAKLTLISYCALATDDFMAHVEPLPVQERRF